jgi:hypothetical protein
MEEVPNNHEPYFFLRVLSPSPIKTTRFVSQSGSKNGAVDLYTYLFIPPFRSHDAHPENKTTKRTHGITRAKSVYSRLSSAVHKRIKRHQRLTQLS